MKRVVFSAGIGILVAGFGFFGSVHRVGADLRASQGAPIARPVAALPTLTMRITAYASDPAETSDHPFITASGEHVRDGIVATNLLPFGTKIQIPALFGDKVFTVEDRMNKKFQNTIDIWMASKEAAIYFGVAHTSVVILNDASATLAGL
jgi:3D (Asp-Asp-Asp) domain-containing protein